MNGTHLDREHAALYALGALSETETAALRAHLRTCAPCAQLAGEAEDEVATIAAAQRQQPAPPALDARVERLLKPAPRYSPAFAGALAAAFLVGILPSLYFWEQSRTVESEMATQRAAMSRVVASAHRTVGFHALRAPLAAKVMYAPDGSWYVVLVKGISRTLDVAWMHDGRQTMLGSATPHDGVAMLYLPKSHRMDRLALMDGEEVVAEAQLPY